MNSSYLKIWSTLSFSWVRAHEGHWFPGALCNWSHEEQARFLAQSDLPCAINLTRLFQISLFVKSKLAATFLGSTLHTKKEMTEKDELMLFLPCLSSEKIPRSKVHTLMAERKNWVWDPTYYYPPPPNLSPHAFPFPLTLVFSGQWTCILIIHQLLREDD